MLVVGSLEKGRISFEPYDFRWAGKHISGFIMKGWLSSISIEER
jgi:hypothetical protein